MRTQVDRFLEAVAPEGACVLVHCGGGKGRAGTVAACCVAMWGTPPDVAADRPVMSAQEAVRLVRSSRPGSIETQEQEAFVQASLMLCCVSEFVRWANKAVATANVS